MNTKLPKLGDQGDSILVGKSQIDDEDVVGIRLSEVLRGFSIRRQVDLISGFREGLLQERLNIVLILH